MLVHALEARDCRVRHDTTLQVQTSGRLFGRARGGMADTMRKRILEPDTPCDERLEPIDRAYFRARTRRLLRELHGSARPHAQLKTLAARVQLTTHTLSDALNIGSFGTAWRAIEDRSPRLVRRPIRPSLLASECARGESLLARLRIPAATQLDLSAVTMP